MPNIFRLDDNYVDKPKRNVFDLSFQNNLTLRMGKLVPVFCKEVLPGDSFKIDPTFGLRYLPQKFPVQTRQRASIKYYYVRNRTLWKHWMDFIGKTKSGLTPPYLEFSGDDNKLLSPSSLADYMGIPVHVKRTSSVNGKISVKAAAPNFRVGTEFALVPNSDVVYTNIEDSNFAIYTSRYTMVNVAKLSGDQLGYSYPLDYIYGGAPDSVVPAAKFMIDGAIKTALGNVAIMTNNDVRLSLYRIPMIPYSTFTVNVSSAAQCYLLVRGHDGVDYAVKLGRTNSFNKNTPLSVKVYDAASSSLVDKSIYIGSILGFLQVQNTHTITINMNISLRQMDDVCWCDLDYSEWPFANDLQDGLRISALPFRAIESIYNALIRNAENNPFRIDGVEEYNKYIVSDEGGETSATHLLSDYYTNWADDRFTTALPSPQQGNAPLVGLTGVQGATLTTSAEDGTTSTLHLQVDADTGNVILVDGVSSDSPSYLSDAIMSAVDYGITINDLRNVNSFQRWLENNIRRGYKYKDQLMSHFGVSARYDVLDMPEFIGGVSRDVDVSQVTQTTQNEYGNLGEYAGQSYINGSGHSIEHYCDEHGFIIGLMCVYPMPIYQDCLPKHLIKSDAFDYYFPEFGKIGPQPITNKELSFSQSFLENNMDEVFGYQRAWYDYLESLDEVHGMYLSDFRNFLIARDFAKVPELGSSFLTISPDDINNTFYSDDDKDKILGQIYHKVSVKRSIPLIGIPSLE